MNDIDCIRDTIMFEMITFSVYHSVKIIFIASFSYLLTPSERVDLFHNIGQSF
jgi:hypothetical protein